MKNKYILFGISCLAAALSACSDDLTFSPDYEPVLKAKNETATVNAATTYQTIDGFASSDAWTMDYVGKYWSDNNKEGIAKLLFSQEVKNNQPEGIGLSMWRVNLGGGTAEQGEASNIASKVNRAECFLNADGTYTWGKCSGQQYFMQKAKEYGCNQFVLFSNTPPVYYTKNGKGYSDNGWYANLKNTNDDGVDGYGLFADYMATVARHFVDEGYNIPFISPLNEPQYDWGPGSDGKAAQEGSGWMSWEIANLAREMDKKLTDKNLEGTNILIAESGSWKSVYGFDGQGQKSQVILQFFEDKAGEYYIGNLKHMQPNVVCGHSYWVDRTWDQLQETRTELRKAAEKNNLKVYQTEWSMLHNAGETMYEDYDSFDDATYMDLALSMAKVLHHDLATANVSSWSYWTTASVEVYSQKSRFYMIRLIPGDGDYGDIALDGTYSASKNLWVLGNYSLFVRPGYKRVDLNIPNGSRMLFGSAYISPEQDRLVVVYTNMGVETIQMDTALEGIGDKTVKSVRQYTTSETRDLKEEADYLTGYIPSKSVVTMVYDLQ
ncbi:glycoside hydrolase [Bacteroides congonensis]|uniref:glycoside hydrolase n=1 Tax=Bacteroides congonensis TaxID=1871006 RepID=UPI003A8C5F64